MTKCEEIELLLLDYEEGRLAAAEAERVRRHLESCPACAREHAALRQLNLAMRLTPAPMPDPQLRASFYTWLETEKQALANVAEKHPTSSRVIWARHLFAPIASAVAACLLFAGGMHFGSRNLSLESAAREEASAAREEATAQKLADLQRQMDSMGKAVAWSLLQQGTASERLRTVLAMGSNNDREPRVVEELLGVLAFDGSSSVRLNAVEALFHHTDQPTVKKAVASALPRETSPIVQLAMIDLLATTRDPAAFTVLEQFVDNESQGELVRDAARFALTRM